jgi:hypothetical protein
VVDQEERDRERRDRAFELLKHVSTLNLAALVLFLALVDSFRQTLLAGGSTGTTTWALALLGVSLLLSLLGLLLFQVGPLLRFIFVVTSYASFGIGVGLAVFLYYANLF